MIIIHNVKDSTSWKGPGRPVGSRRSLADRLWEKVDRSGGPDACWLYTGYRNVQGYGVINDGGRPGISRSSKLIGAHRAAWIVINGTLLPGRAVLHKCDNPPCCNPNHLRSGSQADNAADMAAKGRARNGPRPTLVEFVCEKCGAEATVSKTWLRSRVGGQQVKRRFCSQSCANAGRKQRLARERSDA